MAARFFWNRTRASSTSEATAGKHTETSTAQADFLARAELYQGDWRAADRFMADLRAVSRRIAVQVVSQCRNCGVGRLYRDDEIEAAVDAAMWYPAYLPYRPAL